MLRSCQNDVPLLIGVMRDEASAFPGYTPARAQELRGKELIALDALPAQRARASRQPAFAYYFEHAIPWPQQPQFGAFHSGELPYVFDDLAGLDRPWSAVDRALAAAVSSYWAAFVTSGKPQHAPLAPWSAYVPGSMRFMVFGDRVAMRVLRVRDAPGT